MPQETRVDTHAVIIQASSARLIHLLCGNYPDVRLEGDAQASLVYYLDTLINPSVEANPEELQKAKENPSINGTIAMAEAIASVPEENLSAGDKTRVLKQMLFIARSYPGGDWSEAKNQWSINRFYNPRTQKDETLMTPPAHALNLVCKALLDESHYRPNSKEEAATDTNHRITNFTNQLLELQREVASSQLQKCSAGLQHDLLYLLDNSYLGEDKEPIHLLMDTTQFLQESLVSFIDEQLKAHPGPKTNAMLLDWIRWKAASSSETDCPLILWLRAQFPSEPSDKGWNTACINYLKQRCETFFLNPSRSPLDTYPKQIADSATPMSQNAMIPLIGELLTMGDLQINPASAMASCIGLRNQALVQFKQELESKKEHLDPYVRPIQEFFSVLAAVSSLYSYRDLTLLLGQEETLFNQAREGLLRFISEYLTHYSIDKVMTFEEVRTFENLNLNYRTKERVFLQQSHADFVANFFNIAQEDFDGAWARLHALKPEGAAAHPLILTDEALIQWQAQSGSMSADGQEVLDVTPNAANRLLLHGLMMPVATWTPVYCHYLTLFIDWVIHPSSEDDLNLKTFKQSYPSNLLINLYFMAMTQASELNETSKNQLINHILGPKQAFTFMKGGKLFIESMRNSQLTVEQRTQILDAVGGGLGTFIRSTHELSVLFLLSLEKLNTDHRTQILNSIRGELGALIKDGKELLWFFSLTQKQLTLEHRKQIWDSVRGQLGTLIRKRDDLINFFKLSADKLTLEQRTQILDSVQEKLGTLIQTGSELGNLFSVSLEQLTLEQRTQILGVLQGKLGTLIQHGNDLRKLFSLPVEQLTSEQRTHILDSVQGQLGTLIRDGGELTNLFSLSVKQLTSEQRTYIWSAVQKQLKTLIKSYFDFLELFLLPLDKFDLEQRTQLLDVVPEKIEFFLQKKLQISEVFRLSKEQMTLEQRTKFLDSLGERLGAFIQNGFEFWKLFSLPVEQLSLEQRTQILNSVQGELANLMQSGFMLVSYFSLPLKILTLDHRKLLWDSVQGQLETVILSADHLSSLFALPPKKLTLEQRAQLWDFLREGPKDFIKDTRDLEKFFSLSVEQLTSEQRAQILNSVPWHILMKYNNAYVLVELFKLSVEQLTSEQRTQILNSVLQYARIGSNILLDLFKLSVEQVTSEQRTQILNSVEADYRYSLIDLFSLSLVQLTSEQRTQLLDKLHGVLGRLIQSGEELRSLFALSPEQLTLEQRTKILDAVGVKLVTLIPDPNERSVLLSSINKPSASPGNALRFFDKREEGYTEINFSSNLDTHSTQKT